MLRSCQEQPSFPEATKSCWNFSIMKFILLPRLSLSPGQSTRYEHPHSHQKSSGPKFMRSRNHGNEDQVQYPQQQVLDGVGQGWNCPLPFAHFPCLLRPASTFWSTAHAVIQLLPFCTALDRTCATELLKAGWLRLGQRYSQAACNSPITMYRPF